MEAKPIYGRWQLTKGDTLARIRQRLIEISNEFLRETPFRSFIVEQGGRIHHDCDFTTLLKLHREIGINISYIVSTVVAEKPDEVVRMKIVLDKAALPKYVQYVIATRSTLKNEVLERILLQPLTQAITKSRIDYLYKFIQDTESFIKGHESTVTPPEISSFHDRIPLVLSDYFRFDRLIDIGLLLGLLDELSHKFFEGDSFHGELKTVSGDFYFDISREELIYLFRYQRHSILSLKLDIQSRKGHWISLFLSFQPLVEGPNIEVELAGIYQHVELMANMIWKILAKEENKGFVQPLIYHFSLGHKDMIFTRMVEMFENLSKIFFYRIPPLVELTSLSGETVRGISLYQFRQITRRKSSGIKWMRLYIYRIITQQELSMFINWSTLPDITVTINWGDHQLHQQVKNYMEEQLSLG